MALSEHEQKLLAEMEAALAVDDPRLVGTLSGKARTRQASRVLLGFFAVLCGLAILVAGLIAKSTPIGIGGFIVALFGAFTAISNFSLRQMTGGNVSLGQPSKRPGTGWNDRLGRRWDDRRDN